MDYPKIGIRRVIDGRYGGVRESLESQTENLANAVKDMIEANLYYTDGSPVQCIISDTSIGGSKEAYDCEVLFSQNNVVGSLTIAPCWAYGTETMDLSSNTIKAVWGFNGTERPGAVYLAAVMSAYAQRGIPVFSIYGKDVQEATDNRIPDDVKEKILRFAKGAIAVGSMKSKSYVNIGSVSMGIAGSSIDENFMQNYLGIRSEWVDMTEILRRMKLEIYDKDEYELAMKWVDENCKEGININDGKKLPEIIIKSRVVPESDSWSFVVKHALIIRDIMFGNKKLKELGWTEESNGRNAIVGGFQGQRMWTDWLPNGDFTEAILASSFDWNGIKEPVAFATENDTLNGVSMLFAKLLTQQSVMFSDVRTFWSDKSVNEVTHYDLPEHAKGGIIHLINSGATALDGTGCSKDGNEYLVKKWWNVNHEDIQNMLKHTDWCRANYEYFRGGGFSSHFKTEHEMPITMLRVNIVEGVGPTIQIIEGRNIVLDKTIHDHLDQRTDPTWPTTWFKPRESKELSSFDIMSQWGSNHCAWTYGHIGADLITLSSMLRIPVSLHNIDNNQIFRPHSFGGFGSGKSGHADYDACKHYGPIYR